MESAPKASLSILYFLAKPGPDLPLESTALPLLLGLQAACLSMQHSSYVTEHWGTAVCLGSVFCMWDQPGVFLRGDALIPEQAWNSEKVQERLGSFMCSLPGIDLGLWHDTAFAVLSATAIYTLLFRVILSPLGDSVLDKIFLLKFIKFAEVPIPIWVFWLCGSALALDSNRAECEGNFSLRYAWIQSLKVLWPADWTCIESHMWTKTGTLGI